MSPHRCCCHVRTSEKQSQVSFRDPPHVPPPPPPPSPRSIHTLIKPNGKMSRWESCEYKLFILTRPQKKRRRKKKALLLLFLGFVGGGIAGPTMGGGGGVVEEGVQSQSAAAVLILGLASKHRHSSLALGSGCCERLPCQHTGADIFPI